MHPTPRSIILFSVGIPVSLTAALLNDNLWTVGLVYLLMALLLTGIDAILLVPKRALKISFDFPARFYVGTDADCPIHTTVDAGRRAPVLNYVFSVSDHLQISGPRQMNLRSGDTITGNNPVKALRRGIAHIDKVWLRWSGPLGLVEMRQVQILNKDIAIIPNLEAVKVQQLQLSLSSNLFGAKTQRQQGEGSEFEALRDYVAGLDPRSIDWKHSARHRKLMCKEFHSERSHQIILAFDSGHLMTDPIDAMPKLDHAIHSGLILAHQALRMGDRVGFFSFAEDVKTYTKPLNGPRQLSRLQQNSADMDYHYQETNFTLGLMDLMGRLNRRSLIVLQTDFIDTVAAELMLHNLKRLAAKHLVVFVCLNDPQLKAIKNKTPANANDVIRSVVAGDFIKDRRIVLEKIRRMGIHCLDVPSNQMHGRLINKYMEIKRHELI